MIIIPQQQQAPLWKKIYLHAKSWAQSKYRTESAANWVKVPYTLNESWRAMAYALIQTDGVDDEVKRFVYNYAQQLEGVATQYLRHTYGDGVYAITPSLSARAQAWFQNYLQAYHQREQAKRLEGLEQDYNEWEQNGKPFDNPDGVDPLEEEPPREYGI